MSKELYFEDAAKLKLKQGFDKLANAVSSTLGPNGKTVIIELDGQDPIITKDGVTVAKHINLSDRVENLGCQMLKNVSLLTNQEVGDGTTTATVLAKSILDSGFEAIKTKSGFDIKRELENDLEDIIKELDKRAIKCTKKDIINVAKISTNGDEELSQLIAKLHSKSKGSQIKLEPSINRDTYSDYIEGYSFNSSYIDSFYINADKNQVMYEEPLYLIYNGKFNDVKTYVNILEKISNVKRPLVLIAEAVSNDILHTSFRNFQSNALPNVIIKTPGYGPSREQYLNDIATYTRGIVLNDSTIGKFTLKDLGQSKDILIKESSTIITGGKYKEEELKSYIANLEHLSQSSSDYNKDMIKERISKFKSGIGVLYIGATSELEYKEKYDRAEDAINAVKAAIEEGIVVGGGYTLRSISQNKDSLLYNAIKKPFEIISDNLNSLDLEKVIDPVKVTKAALRNAVSVTSTILTTETVIVNE